jgi:hypothetical protein
LEIRARLGSRTRAPEKQLGRRSQQRLLGTRLTPHLAIAPPPDRRATDKSKAATLLFIYEGAQFVKQPRPEGTGRFRSWLAH